MREPDRLHGAVGGFPNWDSMHHGIGNGEIMGLHDNMWKRLWWELECVAEFQFVCGLGDDEVAEYFQYHPHYDEDETTYAMHCEAALAYLYVAQDLFGDIDYAAYQQVKDYIAESR